MVQCVFTNLQLSGNVVIIHVITAKKETDENGWVQCGWSQFWGFSPNQFSAGWLRIWLLFFGNGHWHNVQRATQVRGGSDVIVYSFYLNRGIHSRRKTPWRHDEAGISSVPFFRANRGTVRCVFFFIYLGMEEPCHRCWFPQTSSWRRRRWQRHFQNKRPQPTTWQSAIFPLTKEQTLIFELNTLNLQGII